MFMIYKAKNRKGFTFIEVISMIGIVVIIAVIIFQMKVL